MKKGTGEIILYNVSDAVATITLNRPAKRNALNGEMVARLKDALACAQSDAEVRAIVITGAGKDFCAGADLASLQRIADADVMENLHDAQTLMELFAMMRRTPLPIIAAVRGSALAGGCGLATACDVTLAARSASFGYPEVKIGFVPAIVMGLLRRSVSEKIAFDLVTRGRIINAEEAARVNLINHVYDDDSFENEVVAYASVYARVSRTAVALTKRLLYQIDGMTLEHAMEAGVGVNTIARMTDDCRAGIARFLKRD